MPLFRAFAAPRHCSSTVRMGAVYVWIAANGKPIRIPAWFVANATSWSPTRGNMGKCRAAKEGNHPMNKKSVKKSPRTGRCCWTGSPGIWRQTGLFSPKGTNPSEPTVHFLCRVPCVHSHIRASVHDEIVPKHKWHWVTTPSRRTNWTGAKLQSMRFINRWMDALLAWQPFRSVTTAQSRPFQC